MRCAGCAGAGRRLLVRRSAMGGADARALALWPAIGDALRLIEASLAPGDFVAASASNTFILAMADATAAELMPGLVEDHRAGRTGRVDAGAAMTTRDPRRLLDRGPH